MSVPCYCCLSSRVELKTEISVLFTFYGKMINIWCDDHCCSITLLIAGTPGTYPGIFYTRYEYHHGFEYIYIEYMLCIPTTVVHDISISSLAGFYCSKGAHCRHRTAERGGFNVFAFFLTFLLPIDAQHNQSPSRFLIPSSGGKETPLALQSRNGGKQL